MTPHKTPQPSLTRAIPFPRLLAVLFLFAAPLSAPEARGDGIKEVRLQKTIAIPAPPSRPLDSNLRVLIYYPPHPNGSNPSWNEIHLKGNYVTPAKPAAAPYTLSFARPFREYTTRVICQFFPRCEVVAAPPDKGYDLLITIDHAATAAENLSATKTPPSDSWKEENLRSLHVEFSLRLEDSSEQLIDLIRTGLTRYPQDRVYLSKSTRASRMGTLLLQDALAEISEILTKSIRLLSYLRDTAEDRETLCKLITEAAFDDAAGLFPNGILDSGEAAYLHLRVENTGPGKAFDVSIDGSATDSIHLGDLPNSLGDIPPGTSTEILLPIQADLSLNPGVEELRIVTKERRGWDGPTLILPLPTAGLKYPELRVASFRFDDSQPLGNGDGMVSNGEEVKLSVQVENFGAGDAAAVRVELHQTHADIQASNQSAEIPLIPAGGFGEAVFGLKVPRTYLSPNAPFSITATEGRGKNVAAASFTGSLSLDTRVPQIRVDYAFHGQVDAASTGPMHALTNGDSADLGLIARNLGTLTAEDLKLEFIDPDRELQVEPRVLLIGDVPPQFEATETRTQVTVARATRLGIDDHSITLHLRVKHSGFPAYTETLIVPFVHREPILELAHSLPDAVASGRPFPLRLCLRNLGDLSAANVVVQLHTSNENAGFLSDRGLFFRQEEIRFHQIDPGGTAEAAVDVQVKGAFGEGGLVIAATIHQDDFPPKELSLPLEVMSETVSQYLPIPDEQSKAKQLAALQPRLISIQPLDGTHTEDQTTEIRFLVEHTTKVSEVRVRSNGESFLLGLPSQVEQKGGTLTSHYTRTLPLNPGRNDLTITAIVAEGLQTTETFTLWRDAEPRLWVLAIGIGKYQDDEISDAFYADSDARDIFEYYESRFDVASKREFLLTNEEATRSNILKLLAEELPAKARDPADTVVIFYAGHMETVRDPASDDDDGYTRYLVPFDGSRSSIISSGIQSGELVKAVQRLGAEKVVLFVDACNSGGVTFHGAASRGPHRAFDASRPDVGIPPNSYGRVLLAATGPHQSAKAGGQGHGRFTASLLAGLRGAADRDRDSMIDFDELYDYVLMDMRLRSAGEQAPIQAYLGPAAGKLVVGKVRGTPPGTSTRPE